MDQGDPAKDEALQEILRAAPKDVDTTCDKWINYLDDLFRKHFRIDIVDCTCELSDDKIITFIALATQAHFGPHVEVEDIQLELDEWREIFPCRCYH